MLQKRFWTADVKQPGHTNGGLTLFVIMLLPNLWTELPGQKSEANAEEAVQLHWFQI